MPQKSTDLTLYSLDPRGEVDPNALWIITIFRYSTRTPGMSSLVYFSFLIHRPLISKDSNCVGQLIDESQDERVVLHTELLQGW